MNRLLGPIPATALHLVIDMQELFRSHAEWGAPCVTRLVPPIRRLLEARPDRAYFSRFIPPERADHAHGMWRQYYRRWSSVTREVLPAAMVEVVDELRPFATRLVDKAGYSALGNAEFKKIALAAPEHCLIVTGVETDVCVLSTVMEAMDLGLRVILVSDGLGSSSDVCHERALGILYDRFDDQIELASVDQIIQAWL